MENQKTPKEVAQESFDNYKDKDLWLHESCLEHAIRMNCDKSVIKREQEILSEYIKLCNKIEK